VAVIGNVDAVAARAGAAVGGLGGLLDGLLDETDGVPVIIAHSKNASAMAAITFKCMAALRRPTRALWLK
jgi:hypothetical protein